MSLLKRKFWLFLQLCCVSVVIFFLYNSNIISTNNSNDKKYSKVEDELKDWNDYELIRQDSLRTGYGEGGKGEDLTDPKEIEMNKKLFEKYGMSVLISDKISVNRSIPEYRHPNCIKKKYFKNLPKVSIIIIFVDEVYSVFIRTLHSLYNRTPHELIEEVILVNDHSTKEYLYEPLKSYIQENFPKISFNIINLKRRHGLMQARVVGAQAAKSEFLFLTEPHCEMTYNWLPPLLQPLIYGHKTVTVPIIDNIEWKQLQYYENSKGNKGSRGVFDWTLNYQNLNRYPVSEDQLLEPFQIPVMTGGIYMIRKSYFFEIGPYDPELIIWGAENIEMSLKINLCGGELLEVPCSHIGHIFRAFTKSRHHESGIDFELFNKKRVVEVWFDDYKQYVYRRQKTRFENMNVGDLTEAKKFKDKLKCKSFEYFVGVIAPDIIERFPLIQDSFASGQIKLLNEDLCIETDYRGESNMDVHLYLSTCYDGINQKFDYSWYRDIEVKDTGLCIDAFNINLSPCHRTGGNQLLKYDIRSKFLIFAIKMLCIEANLAERSLKLAKCDKNIKEQQWIFNEYMNETALEDWDNSGRAFESENSIFWNS